MKRFGLLALILGLFVSAASAQTTQPSAGDKSRLSLDVNAQIATEDVYRGVVLDNSGLSLQPSFTVGYDLYRSNTNLLTNVKVFGGIFEIIDTNSKGAPTNSHASAWFENDLNTGVTFTLANRLDLTVGYSAYTSPNGSFGTIQEVSGRLAYNDTDLWKNTAAGQRNFGLNPYVFLAKELEGSRYSTRPGTYLEAGLRPSIDLTKNISLALPTAVGLSVDDYYGAGSGLRYGYTSVGPELDVALTKNVTLFGGVDFVMRGNDLRAIDHSDSTQVVGRIGLDFKF